MKTVIHDIRNTVTVTPPLGKKLSITWYRSIIEDKNDTAAAITAKDKILILNVLDGINKVQVTGPKNPSHSKEASSSTINCDSRLPDTLDCLHRDRRWMLIWNTATRRAEVAQRGYMGLAMEASEAAKLSAPGVIHSPSLMSQE